VIQEPEGKVCKASHWSRKHQPRSHNMLTLLLLVCATQI